MSEADIVTQVAQNIPSNDPSVDTPIEAPAPDSGETTGQPVYINDPVMETRLLDYFAVGRTEKYSEKTQTQIRNIMEWAATQAQSTDYADVVTMINRLERQLGLNMKPNRMGLLYRYITLHRESQQIQKEMSAINGGFTI